MEKRAAGTSPEDPAKRPRPAATPGELWDDVARATAAREGEEHIQHLRADGVIGTVRRPASLRL